MSAEKNLQSVVSVLKVRTREIKREITSAQEEIKKAKADVAAGHEDHQRLDREIAELKAQLNRVPADQQAKRKEVEQRLASSGSGPRRREGAP